VDFQSSPSDLAQVKMDVSSIIEAQNSKYKSITVERDIPIDVDVGRLVTTDLNPIDEELYNADREAYLESIARDGVQVLLAALFSLPVQKTDDGPVAQLPPPTTILPRAKPLPKPKPPTKWERFADAKGIQKKKRERKVFDEEKDQWVDRWGKDGKNKDKETQWIHEVPDNAPLDFDPSVEARKDRKSRVDKNEKQRKGNLARAAQSSGSQDKITRKKELEKSLATTRGSTASLGRFDKKLEGEPKLRGIKRKFNPTETPVASEKESAMALLSSIDGSKKSRKTAAEPGEGGGGDGMLNVRKAVRFASKGRGAVALAREANARDSGGRGRGGKSGGRGRGRR